MKNYSVRIDDSLHQKIKRLRERGVLITPLVRDAIEGIVKQKEGGIND